MKTKTLLLPLIAAGLLVSVGYAAAKGKTTNEFVSTVAMAGNFEIMTSRVALDNSQNADVKTFANQMITDHGKAADDLKETVSKAGLKQADDSLDKSHQEILERLKTETGPTFDKDYVAVQADAHKEAVDLVGDYAQDGDNSMLRDFASRTLPTLKMHKEHVAMLQAAM